MARASTKSRPESDKREGPLAPDAWEIRFGNGCRFVVWEDYTKALLEAARFHGTIHPLAYIDATEASKKPA
jgi:hypothetical protein